MPAEILLARLQGVCRRGRESKWMARCPAHQDRSASLSVREEVDGRVLVHCFAGCATVDVIGAVGLSFEALFPVRPLDSSKPIRSIRKPWRAGDLVQALEFELLVALVILADVAQGAAITDEVRQRGGEAGHRIAAFLRELEHAA
jgi:hypothetical protein